MKLFKGFVLAIIGLFVVVTLFSLLMANKVMIVRTVSVNAPASEIMASLSNLATWKEWHPALKGNVSMKLSSPSAGNNAFAEWLTGEQKNRIELQSVSDSTIKFIHIREGELPIQNEIFLTSYKDDVNLQVEWRALIKLKWYPWEKFAGIFVDKMAGPGYDAALVELKERVEGGS